MKKDMANEDGLIIFIYFFFVIVEILRENINFARFGFEIYIQRRNSWYLIKEKYIYYN